MPLPWNPPRVPPVLPIFDPAIARWPLSPTLEALAEAGAEWVQYRDKRASEAEFFAASQEAERLCHSLGMYLILNDRVVVAAALMGVGAHVGQSDMTVEKARRLLPDECLGLSTDSDDELRAGNRSAADYLAVGPIFATGSKTDAGEAVGLPYLRSARRLTDRPLLAIGGIDAANAEEAVAAGADCVAVLSAAVAVEDPVTALRAILSGAARGLRDRLDATDGGRAAGTVGSGPSAD